MIDKNLCWKYDNVPEVDKNYLTKGSKKRSGIAMSKVLSIVVHYTATAKVDPSALLRYWKRTQHDAYSSAHFLVGDKSIIECIPCEEIAYHVGAKSYKRLGKELMDRSKKATPNFSTIGIEMCQETAEVGECSISGETRLNTISLVVDTLIKFGLQTSDISTHAQITGKHCPAIAIDGGVFGGHIKKGEEPVMSSWWCDFLDDCGNLYFAKKKKYINKVGYHIILK